MKDAEDEAFDELEKRQGSWGGGYQAKRKMAADKLQKPEREVLKLALEALQLVSIEWVCSGAHHAKKDRHEFSEPCPIVERYHEAITAIKEALAQPAQEPVAHVYLFDHEGRPRIAWDKTKGIKIGDKLYTAPPLPVQPVQEPMSLEIKLPVGFMNAGVSVNNFFTADTNDSKNWDTIKFPLPKGNWVIKSVKENIVTLVNEAPLPVQEPMAWMYQCTADNSGSVLLRHRTNWAESGSGLWTEIPLYTTPPQREWVGLTAKETLGFTSQEMTVVKYVSKVLQEKNNG